MMTQAYYTGISGLKNSSYGIDIVSNNLANISTVGFRGDNYEFASLFENSLATTSNISSNTVGLGTRIQASAMLQEQGSFMVTQRSTDLAILGEGWFAVEGDGKPFYTKNGAFSFDEEGSLVANDGHYVLGTLAGNISGNTLTQQLAQTPLGNVTSQEKLQFPNDLIFPLKVTTEVEFSGNIGTDDELRTMSASVIDAQGNTNELHLEFTKSKKQIPPGIQWDVKAVTRDKKDLTKIYDTQTGLVSFDETGALVSSTFTSINNNGTQISVDLGKKFDGIVAIANLDISSVSSANGNYEGELAGYNINKNGDIVATFSNGMQSSVGKIAVYHFQNDQGLERVSGTYFATSANSGKPIFYKDSNGQDVTGTDMANFRLESSNVDMTVGLTDLIILQRTYDANSKSVTTADQMIQKALNMDA